MAHRLPPGTIAELPQEQRERLAAFVNERWKKLACPSCGSTDLGLGHYVCTLPIYQSGAVVLGGPEFPVVPLACRNCAHVRLISPLIAGIDVEPHHE